jgi:hypothetical protein
MKTTFANMHTMVCQIISNWRFGLRMIFPISTPSSYIFFWLVNYTNVIFKWMVEIFSFITNLFKKIMKLIKTNSKLSANLSLLELDFERETIYSLSSESSSHLHLFKK